MDASRIAFADSNWLFAIYYRTPKTLSALTDWASRPSTLIVSEVVIAECRCAFWRKGDRVEALESDLRMKRYVDCGETFGSLHSAAPDLWRRYCPKFNLHTNDTLHVLAARKFGCPWFLSFDVESGCRALAVAVGLKVYPPLSSRDREILRALKP